MDAEQRQQVAIDIAKMYYIDGISQDDIAKKTGMSRIKYFTYSQKMCIRWNC